MEEKRIPSPAELDPEVFRRVWARVMPDDRSSPIALTPERKPNPPAKAKPQPRPAGHSPQHPRGQGDEELVRGLMTLLGEGIAKDSLLLRRSGHSRPLTQMANDHRRAMKRLSVAYFLLTGGQYRPAPAPEGHGGNVSHLLREQFQWEQRWTQACLRGGEGAKDPAVGELCRELAKDGPAHERLIRSILEGQGTAY